MLDLYLVLGRLGEHTDETQLGKRACGEVVIAR